MTCSRALAAAVCVLRASRGYPQARREGSSAQPSFRAVVAASNVDMSGTRDVGRSLAVSHDFTNRVGPPVLTDMAAAALRRPIPQTYD